MEDGSRHHTEGRSIVGALALSRLTTLLVVFMASAALLYAMGSVTMVGAQTAPDLGVASTYAVLGGQTVTNTGPTTIRGDVGVSPGSSVTGFPPGIVTEGTIHSADSHAAQAQDAVTTAYNALAAEPCTDDLTGQDLGGLVLTAGVYCFSSSAQLTGSLTLNAEGNAGAVFIFKMVSTLTTADNSSVQVINGSNGCNVFWQVGSSAVIGAGTEFVGNILALTSISLTTGANVSGRTLARNGAVTMQTNDVGFSVCGAATASATASPVVTGTVTSSPTITGVPTGTATANSTLTVTPTATPVGPTPTPSATPVGQTPTPTLTPTLTPTPIGQTPAPTLTATPVGQTPTSRPTTPSNFPRTGGPGEEISGFWWALLAAVIIGAIGSLALTLSFVRSHARPYDRGDRR